MARDFAFAQKLLYVVPTKLPPDLIRSMKKYISGVPTKEGTIDNFKNKKDVRSSTVGFIAKDEWISGIIYNAMVCANDAYFKYDLTHFDGNVQATWYKGEKQDHYTWHTDNGGNTMRPREHGVLYERKLSCSLVLSNPDDYVGGELQFHYGRFFFETMKPEIGSIVVFPSWLPHRVRPIKSGERISLVAWMNGPAFK